MNVKLLGNTLISRCIKRLQSSIPKNIVSNYAKIYLEKDKVQDFAYFIKNNQIKCVKMDYQEEKDHFSADFFLSDVESLNKIFNSREYPFKFQTFLSDDGSVSTPNRITILHKEELCEEIKSLIPIEYFISTELPHKRFYHIYCQTEDQFNSLFFQNGIQKNVSIERTHFPYIKNMTLKISPNIINVYFPEEIEKEQKAAKIFSGLRFNKIVKPSNPKAPWKFYLSNEKDYLKMLSRPYFYMKQCLLILPYYGLSGYLYDGEKKIGNSLLIYSKNKIGNIYDGSGRPLVHKKDIFENGYIASVFGDKKSLDNFRFLNGIKLNGIEYDYTMIFGDEINKFNLVSPYLQITAPLDFDINLIKSQIAPFIYNSNIKIANNLQYLIMLPLSFKHYLDLLKLSFKINAKSVPILPNLNVGRYTYLSKFFPLPKDIYQENKEEIDKSLKPLEIIENEKGFLLLYRTSEMTDMLFQLARYDKIIGSVQRGSTSPFKYDHVLSSNRSIVISGKYLDLLESKRLEHQTHNYFKVDENNWLLFFQKIEHSFPYLFLQIIELNNSKVLCRYCSREYDSITSLDSFLPVESTIKLLNFYGIKYITFNEDKKSRFQLKIETLDDFYNLLSMVDEFEYVEYPYLKINPGHELIKL